ncbi:MAG: V4R domain-containing protein [Gemmatimonadaceae bacterium]
MNLTGSGMVAITQDAMTGLRNALMRDMGYAAAGYLQEAGYAGGGALFEAFRGWLATRGENEPESLSVSDFQAQATDFFRECGWGSLEVGDLYDTVATLDSSDWGEATPGAALEQASCHFTSGMFSDFFGRLSDAPLAVMEVECRSAGADRCRFLLGSTEIMEHVYTAMSGGETYEDAVGAAA